MISGFQLQFVYLLPSDRVDRRIDKSGELTNWINEGQEFLKQNLGLTLPIDLTSSGYDIFFHQSKYSWSELDEFVEGKPCAAGDNLIAVEFGISCLLPRSEPLTNKYYVFLVDLRGFTGNYCGYAAVPERMALVAVGTEFNCSGMAVSGFSDWAVYMWLHEVFHGLGVKHLPSGSYDLMQSRGDCERFVIDPKRLHYVGRNQAGVDILSLHIWQKP